MSNISDREAVKSRVEAVRRVARLSLDSMTTEENAALTKAAEEDTDNPPADDLMRRRGRPPLNTPKRAVKLRLDAEVIDRFKAGGGGWQTRINEALRKVVGLT